MVLIHDRIIMKDICNFEMSYKTPEKSLKSNQIYSAAWGEAWLICGNCHRRDYRDTVTSSLHHSPGRCWGYIYISTQLHALQYLNIHGWYFSDQ